MSTNNENANNENANNININNINIYDNILNKIDSQIENITKVREDGNKLQEQKLGELKIIHSKIENKYTELNELLKDIYKINVTMVEVLDADKSDRFFIDIRYTERENIFKRIKLSDYRKVLKKSEDEVNEFFKDILEYLLGSIVEFNCGEEEVNKRIEELKNNEKSKAEQEANSIITELANIEDKKDKLIYLTRMVVAYAVKTKDAYTFEYETLGWRKFGKKERFMFANKMIYFEENDDDIKYKDIICVNDYSEYIAFNSTSDEAFNMIAELMNYDKCYPRIILSAALSGIIRQKLRLNNEAGININIQGNAGTGKTTIEKIALGMFGSADDLIGSFTNTNNSIDVSRVNKGVIPYVMDEQMIKYIDKSDKAKSKGILVDIFRTYANKVKETSYNNKYKGRLSYGAYISSSVQKIFDMTTSEDLGQFRRLIELNITKNSLFCNDKKETASSKINRYEKIISANSGYFIKEFVETTIRLEKEKPEEIIYEQLYDKVYNLYELIKLEKEGGISNNIGIINDKINKKVFSNKKDIGFIEKLYESWIYEIGYYNKGYKEFTKEKLMALEDAEFSEDEAEKIIKNIKQLIKMDKKLALLATTCEIALITLLYKHIDITIANSSKTNEELEIEINELMNKGINAVLQKTRDMIDNLESNILNSFEVATKEEMEALNKYNKEQKEAQKELVFLVSEKDIDIFCDRLEAMLKEVVALNLKYKINNEDVDVLIHDDKDDDYTFINKNDGRGHNQVFKTGTRIVYQYLVNEVAKTIYIIDEMELEAENNRIKDELGDIIDKKEESYYYIKTEELMKKYVKRRPNYLTPGETSKSDRAVHYSTNSCVTLSVAKLREELKNDLKK